MDTGVSGTDGQCDGQYQTQRNTRASKGGDSKCSLKQVKTKPDSVVVKFEDPDVPDFSNDDSMDDNSRKSFACSHCGRKFTQRQTLKQHERIHTGEKPFQCLDCNKRFRQQSALRLHRKAHTGDRAFECFVCCKRFYRSADLKAHLGIHTGVREHTCSVCTKGFGRPSDLRRHLQTHKAEAVLVVDKTPHECSHCGKKFSRLAQLEIHQRVHTGEKPYQCAQCGESFRWKQNFRTHQRNHTCVKPFHCSDCDRRFTCLSALEKHQIRFHSGLLLQSASSDQGSSREGARHQCCQCGKSFNKAKDLLVHQRVHTGEKPYKCSECEKRFRQVGHLKEHQRVHSGEKPYQCSVCYKCFPYSQSMKKHMRMVHGAHHSNTEVKDFSLMDDVEEVQICSAPSSPALKLSDDCGASEELTHQSDPKEKKSIFITNDVDSAPSSQSSKLSDAPGVPNELRHHVKTEQMYIMEDGSVFSRPTPELSKYPKVFDHLAAHQVKSEEKCLNIMDDVLRVKVEAL